MRVACIDLPAFPLQLVWRQDPAWRAAPVVVIDQDRPQGQVLWACERARAAGVLVGQRYAYALALCDGLRARTVPDARIAEASDELRTVLHRLSPRVEPGEPGTFWLDGDGLAQVFPDGPGATGSAWAHAIQHAVGALGYRGAVVVGGSRFATYAIARATRLGTLVLRGDAEERAMASAVPLARLDLAPALRDALGRLGVTQVGALIRLPGGGLLERFGREAHRLHQLAAGEAWDPVVAVAPPEASDERVVLDDDETDLERLVFAAVPPIDRLLARLAARGRALTALHVELAQKHAVGQIEWRVDRIVPAAPTLDRRALVRLLHLRLTSAPPAAPINALRVWADELAATREQLALFAARPRRDLAAANDAVARLVAELGDDAVVCAALRDGHLPEARFAWQRLAGVVTAQPRPVPPPDAPGDGAARPLIRRVLARPRPLPALAPDAVVRVDGPHVVSGGWWAHAVAREYHVAELATGERLWIYYDRERRRWYWQGAVE